MRSTLAVVRYLMLVVIAGSLARLVGDAGAQAAPRPLHALRVPDAGVAGELLFVPAAPRAGSRVEVSYHPSAELAPDSVLVLRAVFRAPADWMRNQLTLHVVEATRLRRGRDGRFHGAFTFPAQASYGRFAVGSIDSLRADGNGGRHWPLLVYGTGGRPTAGALSSAAWDEMLRNDWDRALVLAGQLTTLYPNDPGSWTNRAAIERGVVGEGRFAARMPAYAARLVHFDSVETARGDGDRLGSLLFLAFQLRDSARAVHWRARLIGEAPLHPLAVQERMEDLGVALRGRPAALLDSLEAIWRDAGLVHRSLMNVGRAAAQAAGDTAALRRWMERGVHEGAIEPDDGATQLALLPALAPEALRRLAASLDTVDRGLAPRLGDVDATLPDIRRAAPSRRREILTAMARASLQLGDTASALAQYVSASESGWSPATLRAARTLARARGEKDVMRRMSALFAADPMTTAAVRDSIRAADPALTSDDGWRAFLAEGEREMIRRLPVEPSSVDASSSIRLATWGTTTPARYALGRGRATVIALWSPNCPYSRPHLPALAHMDTVLRERGIALLVVTRDPPSTDLAEFVHAQRARPPIYHDPENTVGRTFAAYGYPWFFVLDGEGRLRAKGHDIGAVAAEAIAVVQRK